MQTLEDMHGKIDAEDAGQRGDLQQWIEEHDGECPPPDVIAEIEFKYKQRLQSITRE